MMYIFEGVDHAGKDTVIEQLKLYLGDKMPPVFDGFNVFDKQLMQTMGGFVENKDEWQKAICYEVANFCYQTNTDVIINRFNWSELVYGDVFRGGANWHFYFDKMESMLKDIATVVYVSAPHHILLDRLENSSRDKSKIVPKLSSLLFSYEEIIKKTKLPVVRIESHGDYLFDKRGQNMIAQRIFGGTT